MMGNQDISQCDHIYLNFPYEFSFEIFDYFCSQIIFSNFITLFM